MNDDFQKEFDRLFRKEINKSIKNSSPSIEESTNLFLSLDRQNNKKKKNRFLPFILPFFLGSVACSLVSSLVLNNKYKIDSTAKNIKLKDSTAYNITYIFDTIYKKVYINRNVYQNNDIVRKTPNGIFPNSKYYGNLNNSSFSSDLESPNYIASHSNKDLQPIMDTNKVLNNFVISDKLNETNTIPVLLNSTDTNEISDNSQSGIDQSQKNEKKETENLSQKIAEKKEDENQTNKPKVGSNNEISEIDKIIGKANNKILENQALSYRLGFGIGTNKIVGVKNMTSSNSISYLMSLEFLFGSKWAIVPDIIYTSNTFDIDYALDPNIGFPAPKFPGNNYVFDYLDAKTKKIIPALSLRYRYMSRKVFSLYGGLGYAHIYNLKGPVEYEFIDTDTKLISKYSIDHKLVTNRELIKLHFAGLYHINNKIGLITEVSYYTNLYNVSNINNNFNANIGLNYLLK